MSSSASMTISDEMYRVTIIVLAVTLLSVEAYIKPNPKSTTRYFRGDVGPALHVTPYIQSGDIRQARDLSLVTGLTPNITSYSGFITIDQKCDSNLFFWFFPSQNDWLKDPVSLWLNGGPGTSSMYGLLTENGPYALSLDGKLGLREYSWNRNSSVIFIDNPVQTGFSYSGNGCFATDQTQVGAGLLEGLEQFFKLFPEISKNPFFLTGESYAGKYIPAVAYAIYNTNSSINLQGLAIGNGFTDPLNQLQFDKFLYQLGIADSQLGEELRIGQNKIASLIYADKYGEGNLFLNEMISQTSEKTGIYDLYNYLFENGQPEPDFISFLDQSETRGALHVGNTTWHNEDEVFGLLWDDRLKSVKTWMEVLLDKYRIVLYFGQLDIACGYPMALNYIQSLHWSASTEYQSAPRNIWKVGDRVAGYSKTAGRFTEVLVRNAGHMVPTDQPEWALDLYHKLIFNQPF